MSVLPLVAGALVFVSPVSNYRCGMEAQVGQGNVAEVNDAYMRHSIAIIDAALKGNREPLDRLVAADAKFTVFQGDVGLGPRSSGASAAAEFFADLAPTKYQLLAAGAGPFAMDPCGPVSSEVLLMKDGSDEAFQLTFDYKGGILMKVTGGVTSVIEGSLATEFAHG